MHENTSQKGNLYSATDVDGSDRAHFMAAVAADTTAMNLCLVLLDEDDLRRTALCAFAASDTCIHIYFCHNTFPNFNGISGTYLQTAAAGNTVTGTDKGFFLFSPSGEATDSSLFFFENSPALCT